MVRTSGFEPAVGVACIYVCIYCACLLVELPSEESNAGGLIVFVAGEGLAHGNDK